MDESGVLMYDLSSRLWMYEEERFAPRGARAVKGRRSAPGKFNLIRVITWILWSAEVWL